MQDNRNHGSSVTEVQRQSPIFGPFRRRLLVKLATLIVAILILGFGALVTVNIWRESESLVNKTRETARLLSASILKSIENGMLEGRPDIVRRLVHDLKAELKDVRHLEVYRVDGVEAFTDLDTVDEVNILVGLEEDVVKRISKMRREPGEKITHPLFTRAVETMTPQETYETPDGSRLLTFFQPLRNGEECQDCHGTVDRVRGVLRVSLGLDKLDAELEAARTRQIIVALLTILGVAVSLVIFTGRVVLKPIARVVAVARCIGECDFEARVGVLSQDEIGELGGAINEMANRLKTAHQDLEVRNAELATTLEKLRESTQKVELLEQIKGELVKFVPESVTKLLEKNPDALELDKHEADVSVLFLDVEAYTKLSEELPPHRLNRLIQDYFSSFLEVIRSNHGEINEQAGDGLMVIFQSEGDLTHHALNAAGAALQIQSRVKGLNRDYEGVYPPILIHVGINSGVALVGATKLDAVGGGRWTFTASGSTTNLAARIAALAKGGEIMLGPETAERIRGHHVLEEKGDHRLKNVSEPVRVFRLVLPGVYTNVAT